MGISTEYDPLRPMAIQKNWHLTFQPKFMLFAQRSQTDSIHGYLLNVYKANNSKFVLGSDSVKELNQNFL